MRAWPKAFDFDPVLRALFVSACETLTFTGQSMETWLSDIQLDKKKVDVPTRIYVWEEAKRLLNY